MRTVLVTGAIGSGKSALCSHLSGLGFPVYDCDSRCKALYESVPGLKARVEEVTGLPFERLGEVFGNPSTLKALEDLVYPLLVEDFLAWRGGLSGDVCYMESAVAAGNPLFDGLYDELWLVRAPFSLRCVRNPKASSRDGLQSFGNLKPDRIFENDSTLDNLYNQL